MRHRWTKLSLLVAGALMVPATLGVAALPGVASAATVTAKCSAASLTIVGTSATVNLSGCNDTANTGGSGKLNAAAILPSGPTTVKIKWANLGTTKVSLTVTQGEGTDTDVTDCTVGDTEYEAVGKVLSDTGKAVGITVGGKVSAEICVTPSFSIYLEPGTKFKV
jgi:hypothetical protein